MIEKEKQGTRKKIQGESSKIQELMGKKQAARHKEKDKEKQTKVIVFTQRR